MGTKLFILILDFSALHKMIFRHLLKFAGVLERASLSTTDKRLCITHTICIQFKTTLNKKTFWKISEQTIKPIYYDGSYIAS